MFLGIKCHINQAKNNTLLKKIKGTLGHRSIASSQSHLWDIDLASYAIEVVVNQVHLL